MERSASMAISFFILVLTNLTNLAASTIQPRIHLDDIAVGGEIGRRIDCTIDNNVLMIDSEGDFLLPFQERNRSSGYIGLGKYIDSLVRLATYSKRSDVIELKNHIVAETIQTQEDDGYIGMFVPESRMWTLWDIHEMAYIANGLVSNYQFFNHKPSLDAAKQLMDYIIRRWRANPNGMEECDITVFMAVTGLEETLLMMYEVTEDQRYLDFCTEFRKLPDWKYPIVMGRFDEIGGHAYAFFHRCLAQLRLH